MKHPVLLNEKSNCSLKMSHQILQADEVNISNLKGLMILTRSKGNRLETIKSADITNISVSEDRYTVKVKNLKRKVGKKYVTEGSQDTISITAKATLKETNFPLSIVGEDGHLYCFLEKAVGE